MIFLIFIYGLLIGSFLNVCIYRIPREESIVFPSSHCPNCGTSLKWHDLVPVFSYIVQRGKCRYCGEKISSQYPIVELINAFMYLLLFEQYGFTLEFFFFAIVFSMLIIITFIDLQHMIIPDLLVIIILGSTIIYKVLSFLLYNTPFELINSIGGLVLSGLLFIIIILVSKGGMGGGDVTLIAALGFITGIKRIFLIIFLSFILGAIISVFLLITKIKGKKDPIPFGPFIVLGFFINILLGDLILNLYMSFLYNIH